MEIDSKLSGILRRYLQDNNLTQADLAQRCYIKQATVARYLSGKIHSLPFSTLRALYTHIKKPLIIEYFSNPLKHAMSRLSVDVKHVADNAGLNVSRIESILNGEKIPDYGTWIKLRKYFGEDVLPGAPSELYAIDTVKTEKGWGNLLGLAGIRKRARISQSQLADLAGVNQRTVSSYELCIRKPHEKHVELIARALGVSPMELYQGLLPGNEPHPAERPLDINFTRVKNLPEEDQQILKALGKLNPSQKKKLMRKLTKG